MDPCRYGQCRGLRSLAHEALGVGGVGGGQHRGPLLPDGIRPGSPSGPDQGKFGWSAQSGEQKQPEGHHQEGAPQDHCAVEAAHAQPLGQGAGLDSQQQT